MGTQTNARISTTLEKKKLIRRKAPDRSQRIRRTVQWLFVALNGWLGVQFYLWVRYFERGGEAIAQQRCCHVVEQGSEPFLFLFPCCFSHTVQPLGHAVPALCRVHVRLTDVLLRPCPSLHSLRRRLPFIVRLLHG